MLSDLFARAVDYGKYMLFINRDRDQDYSKHVPRFGKKIGVQMRPHDFSGSDPIAMLSFLIKLKNVCSPNRVLESTAV